MTEEKAMKPEENILFGLDGKQKVHARIIGWMVTLMAVGMLMCNVLQVLVMPRIIVTLLCLASSVLIFVGHLKIIDEGEDEFVFNLNFCSIKKLMKSEKGDERKR